MKRHPKPTKPPAPVTTPWRSICPAGHETLGQRAECHRCGERTIADVRYLGDRELEGLGGRI